MSTTHLIRLDVEKRQKIRNYLQTQEKIPLKARLPWKSANVTQFDVYEVPTKLLSYNFKNIRIRSEFHEFIHTNNKKINPNNKEQQKVVHNILLNSKWFGEMATRRLMEDLQNRGQLDPAVARPDGVLIDGNRRLAILRQLEENTESDAYSMMYVCFLPDDSTEDDFKALEIRIQMTQSYVQKYGDINIALEFRHLHDELEWTAKEIEEITGKYYKEQKIRDMIRTINMIDECLLLLPPKGKHEQHYSVLDKGWEGFDNLTRILKWTEKTKPENIVLHERIKILGFQIMTSPETTYSDVRKLYRILRQKESSAELHKTSPTLQGKLLSNPLTPSRIEDEIRYLENANDVWKDYNESPYVRALDALKKLETINLRKQMVEDEKLLSVLDKIAKKVDNIRSKF